MKKDTTYVQTLAVEYQANKSERVFSEIYKNVAPGLTHYVRKIVKDDDHAADVVSQAFINAIEKIELFNPEWKFTTWIYKIAHNVAVYQLRKKSKKKVYSFGFSNDTKEVGSNLYESWLLSHAAIPVSAGIGVDMDNELNNNAVDDLFYKAMELVGELDEFDNMILMNALSGVDHQTQADQHDMSYSTMRNAVFRARHAVKDKLIGSVEEKEWRHFRNATQEARTDFELAAKIKKN